MSREDLAHAGDVVRKITHAQFLAELKAQGVKNAEHCAFVCPMCHTLQSAHSLIRAGVGKTFEEVENKIGFSCIGRFTGQGTPGTGKPEMGCNWTLGGLFRTHKLEVEFEGKQCPHFELATPEAAQRLQKFHEEHGGQS